MGWLILAVMLVPVAAGLVATALPAFGYLPAVGAGAASLAPWREALGWPGLGRSLALTVSTGLAATAIALAAALSIAVAARRSRVLRAAEAWIAPILATPHAALAIGLAFLLAPSGWLARLLSPDLTGWQVPPDIATVQDPHGLALVAGLVLKETPYLLLSTFAALVQADAGPVRRIAASLGYGPWRSWSLVVLPRVWPQLRLPVMAVLAYALSVVDVALILGPGNPPTLAVQVLRLLSDPDLSRWLPGCATALLLCGVVAAALGALLATERGLAAAGRAVARRGRRGGAGQGWDALALGVASALGTASIGAVVVLALWSVAGTWPFPAALPRAWSLETWRAQAALLIPAAFRTATIGAAATVVAVALAVVSLEHERRRGAAMRGQSLLYVPLLVPQLAFLFGMQVVLVRLGLDGTVLAVAWAHLVFVLPYVWLALAGPFRALDPRYARAAASLGVPPWRVLLRVTLPLLARPLLAACAVGFAVSAGLYLPTLFAGAGRVATLTTEAVTLAAAGSDRRVVGAAALAQAVMPLALFALAVALPGLMARRRRALAVVV